MDIENKYTCYKIIDQTENDLMIYDTITDNFSDHGSVTYHDNIYHIVIGKRFFNQCFLDNEEAVLELFENIQKMSSVRYNIRKTFKLFFILVLIMIPFGLLSQLTIYPLSYNEQNVIMFLFKLLLFLFFASHVVKVFITNKYSKKQYKHIFSTIQNKQYKDSVYDYYEEVRGIAPTKNPLKGVLRKTIWSGVFNLTMIFLFFILLFNLMSPSYRFTVQSFTSYFSYMYSTIVPIKQTSNYELINTNQVEAEIDDRLRALGDYYYVESPTGGMSLYDENVELVVSDVTAQDYFNIDEDYIIVNLRVDSHYVMVVLSNNTFEERVYVIDMNTDSILYSFEGVGPEFFDHDYWTFIDFSVDDNTIYFIQLVYDEEFDREEYNLIFYTNGMYAITSRIVESNNVIDMLVRNDDIYLIYNDLDTNELIISKKPWDSQDFFEISRGLDLVSTLVEYNDDIYFREHSFPYYSYIINEEDSIEMFSFGPYTTSRAYSMNSLLTYGTYPIMTKVYNYDGEVLSTGIPFDLDEIPVTRLENDQIVFVTREAKYYFAETSNTTKYYKIDPEIHTIYDSTTITQTGFFFITVSGLLLLTAPPVLKIRSALKKNNKRMKKFNQ